MLAKSFFSDSEKALSDEFVENGYVIKPVENQEGLKALQRFMVREAKEFLSIESSDDLSRFLEKIHEQVSPDNLNSLRLHLFRKLNDQEWAKATYYSFGRTYINEIVGNELAMQNRINLSIQMPRDKSSLLDIHADSFSGESPYQIVQWLPLVDVERTKSMFILPHKKSKAVISDFASVGENGMKDVYETVKKDLIWLEIPFGNTLIFSPNCLHGNIVNDEEETRWSFNCRFSPLLGPTFSPEKALGSFYQPITIRAGTLMGLSYEEPSGFSE